MLVEIIADKGMVEVVEAVGGHVILRVPDPLPGRDVKPVEIKTFPGETPLDQLRNRNLMCWCVLSIDANGQMELG